MKCDCCGQCADEYKLMLVPVFPDKCRPRWRGSELCESGTLSHRGLQSTRSHAHDPSPLGSLLVKVAHRSLAFGKVGGLCLGVGRAATGGYWYVWHGMFESGKSSTRARVLFVP